MTFIEKQHHGKHIYYYLVKSVRLSASKVRKVRIFLGRSIPSHDALQGRFGELERKAPRPYSPHWLSKECAERLEDLRTVAKILKAEPEGDLPRDFLVRFTYNTNAIEGNPLTLRQTALILSEGIMPQGAKTNDVVEVINGRDAWEYVKCHKRGLDMAFVCRIQYEVTKNTSCRIQGSYRDSEVGITGSEWKPPNAKEVPGLMDGVFREYKMQKKTLHPVELAAWLHNRVAQNHPFTDGNGRTARLLMNWVLLRAGFPPAIIEAKNKEEYYHKLEEADKGDHGALAEFLARELLLRYTAPAIIEQ